MPLCYLKGNEYECFYNKWHNLKKKKANVNNANKRNNIIDSEINLRRRLNNNDGSSGINGWN